MSFFEDGSFMGLMIALIFIAIIVIIAVISTKKTEKKIMEIRAAIPPQLLYEMD